jgi:hypothetical protein
VDVPPDGFRNPSTDRLSGVGRNGMLVGVVQCFLLAAREGRSFGSFSPQYRELCHEALTLSKTMRRTRRKVAAAPRLPDSQRGERDRS